jgi:hypothetical protein
MAIIYMAALFINSINTVQNANMIHVSFYLKVAYYL